MTSDDIASHHLSDFRFDRLLARELDGTAEHDAALAHLAACAACAGRYGELERQAVAFPPEAARRHLAERVARRVGSETARRRRWSWLGGLTVAAAAGAVLLLARPRPPDDGMRAKGSFALEVWVARRGGGAAEALLPDGTVSPGDALRFGVRTPAGGGHVAVAGIDAAGLVSLYVPAAAGRLPAVPGGAALLDGAVELDETRGREHLIALLCPAPLETGRVVEGLRAASRAAGGDPAALDVERANLGCAHTGFWLQKAASR